MHSRYDFGYVSHAVAAAIKNIVREFDVLVAQLEHLLVTHRLTLQKLAYLLQPTKSTFCSILHPLILRIQDCAGGRMLDAVHAAYLAQGDSKAKLLLHHLVQQAAAPFLKMLSQWLYRGELHDPYHEFLIQEDLSIARETLQEDFNAQYWDSRYTVRDKNVPKLMRDYVQKILIAGKYFHVVRGSLDDKGYHVSSESSENLLSAVPETDSTTQGWKNDIQLPLVQEIPFDFDHSLSSFMQTIDQAYTFSSQALLRLLITDYSMLTHFRSLRKFFLLENGDFFIQFMDMAEDELRGEVKDVSLHRIQNLLQLAIQTSTLANDPHREDLSCSLASHNLIQHLHLIQVCR